MAFGQNFDQIRVLVTCHLDVTEQYVTDMISLLHRAVDGFGGAGGFGGGGGAGGGFEGFGGHHGGSGLGFYGGGLGHSGAGFGGEIGGAGLESGLGHVDYHHYEHHDSHYHKALAVKSLLVPLAGQCQPWSYRASNKGVSKLDPPTKAYQPRYREVDASLLAETVQKRPCCTHMSI